MIQLKNILLPVDFSDASLEATRYGLELAKRFGARLHLLYVIEDPMFYLPIFDSSPRPSRAEFEDYARDRLENWILPDDAQGCEIVCRWIHGTPWVEIIRDADAHDVDVIVMGTHGRGPAAHLLMGSVAERVVRQAHCPVLTVRPEGHQFVHPGEAARGQADMEREAE